MTRKYLSDSHRAISEACQKEVAEMLQHPLSFEQKMQQVEENHKTSFLQGTQENSNS